MGVVIVLVCSWCITNHCKFSHLKQHLFIISQFYWSGVQHGLTGIISTSCLPRLQMRYCQRDVNIYSSGSSSKLMIVGRIQFLAAIWLMSPFYCQQFSRGHCHLLEASLKSLSCGSLHRYFHNMVAFFSKASRRFAPSNLPLQEELSLSFKSSPD